MISNLAKTPLMAMFYAALLYFSGVFPPFSQSYRDASAGFAMPLSGYLLLLGYALLVSVFIMFVFSSLRGGLLSMALFFVTIAGFLWIIPSLPMLWYGDRENIVTNLDLLLNLARGVFCTLMLFLTAALIRKKDAPSTEEPKKDAVKRDTTKPETSVYKLGIPIFIVKIFALPFLYLVLYLADWYFLGWKNDAVRLYNGGPEQAETLVKAVLEHLLLVDATFLPFLLLNGLLIVLFLLPLLTRLASKRIAFIVGVLLMSLSVGVGGLVPVPWIPAQLRFALFVRDTVLLVLFSVICAALLHLSYKKQADGDVQKPTLPKTPEKSQKAAPQVAGVSAKQAASVVQSTMRGTSK